MTKILWVLSRLPNTKHKIALFFFFKIYIAFPISVSPTGKKEDYMNFFLLVSIDV